MSKEGYFPEIDGLRAIAVLSVVIFHAGVEKLQGGFVGVDIFYVISGYLITRLIYQSLVRETFSFAGFYARRAKRLLPAAVFVVVFSVFIGFFFLTTDAYIALAKSAIYSSLFVSNVWFMNNSGYFDLATQVSPLVHMWSLSVEEQFYFLFPFVLYFAYKSGKLCTIKIVIFTIILLSLLSSILFSQQHPNFSFYMLATRAWELGIGAAIALQPPMKSPSRSISGLLSFFGLLLITYSLVFLSESDIYPGYLALFPVIGTAFIIYSLVNNKGILNDILSRQPFLLIGKASYSIYLWHWPIVVYYRIYINQRDFNLLEVCSLVLVSIAVGYMSWRYIEVGYRYQDYSTQKVFSLTTAAVSFSVVLAGVVYLSNGFPQRISESEIAVTDAQRMWQFTCTDKVKVFTELDEEFCVIGASWDKSEKKGLVWGDSHSEHWAQLLHHEALKNNISLVIAPKYCPPYLNSAIVSEHYPKFPNFTDDCTVRNKIALDRIKDNHDIGFVIMASAWSGHLRMLYTDTQDTNKFNTDFGQVNSAIGAKLSVPAFDSLLSQLDHKKILILGDVPRPNRNLNDCAASEKTQLVRSSCDESNYKYLDYKKIKKWHQDSDEVLISMSEKYENVTTIIPSHTLCDVETCQTFINDELIYKDGNHIRRNLSNDTVNLLSKKIGLDQYLSSI